MKRLKVYMLLLLAAVSCMKEERSPDEILIPSPAQVKCSETSFTLNSTVPKGTEDIVYNCGFYVGKDNSMSGASKVTATMQANSFSADLPSREYGTTYYICSYVTNGHELEFKSDVTSFKLEVLDQYVKLGEVSIVSYDSSSKKVEITIGADVTAGVNVTEAGACYGTEPNSLTIDGNHKTGIYKDALRAAGGAIAITLDGFDDATQYYIRAYIKDGEYLSYGDVMPFYIPSVAKVATFEAEAVTTSGATLSGEITDECGSSVTERGFVWVEGDGLPTVESDKVAAGSGLGVMTATVEGLLPNRKYTFRAYAVNNSGIAYGESKAFTTLVALPELEAATVTDVTSTSATFSGVVANDGGEQVSEVGFLYSADKEVDASSATKVSASAKSVEFSTSVKGLTLKTRYYVKAYAVNSAGTSYGEVTEFETAGEIASIITVGASDVTTNSAVLSGNITTDNGERITERGFVWMEGAGNPTIDSNKIKVSGTTGEFTSTLKNLDPNKKYSFRAYAVNAEGTAYGDVKDFTTLVALPVLSDVVVSAITSTSADISSKVTSHGGETVTEVGFYYSTDAAVDPSASKKVSQLYSSDSYSITVTDLSVYTKYYVRAYAKNSAGEAYGEVGNFMTAPAAPTVMTSGTAEITQSSAVLMGTVVSDNGDAVTERGFVWLMGEGVPTTDSYKVKAAGTTGAFTAALSGLEPNKKYSFRAYAINSKGTSYGETMSFSTVAGLPEIANASVSDITSTTAVFSSVITAHNGSTVSEVGFYYSTSEVVDPATSEKVSLAYSNDSFSYSVSGLSVNTKYYVKAFATNSAGTVYSTVASFATLASTPAVSTHGATEVTSTSALLSGSVLSDNGAAITERGFVWVMGDDTPTTSSHKLKVNGTTGEYSSVLSGLDPNKKYSFRAYAINAEGTSYGEIVTFVTVAGLPTLTAVDVASVTSDGAVFSSSVTGHGGATVTEVGFYYSTDPAVEPASSQKASQEYAKDAFTITVSNLSVYTKYYVKAYAVNAAGTAYSTIATFTTASSTPVVTTLASSEVKAKSAVLSGSVVTDNGASVTERGFVWVSGTATPTTSSSKLKASGNTGDFSATLSGLEPCQTYSYRAYAINANGTSYGEVMDFTTIPDAMTLTTSKAIAVTAESASVSGSVTYYGGNEVAEVGVCWSSNQTPTVSDSHKAALSVSDNFTVTLDGLNENTTYYVRAYATAKTGVTYYGTAVSFTTLYKVVLPSASKAAVSAVTAYGATFAASVTSDGHGTVSDAGFVYSTSLNPTLSDNKKSCGAKTGDFTAQITDLTDGTTYYVRAYVTNEAGTSYGEEVSFTTTAIKVPTVSAVTVGKATFNSASFTAEVTDLNNGTLSDAGFVYSTSQNPDLNSTKISCGKVTSLSGKATDLEELTTYYVRAYAVNEKGIAYGAEVSFTTEDFSNQFDIDADDFKPEVDWD